MMPEIALNVLDIAQNSVRAEASLIQISVDVDEAADTLTITIEDNGCGMTAEQTARVTDPFFTTRTTRKIGLGVPFFKMAAESTGGSFSIQSEPGVGTKVTAVFGLSHIDRMPLGDMNGTIYTLITFNTQIDFLYTYTFNQRSFTLDTREFKNIGIEVYFVEDNIWTMDNPEVSEYIRQFLNENSHEVDGGAVV